METNQNGFKNSAKKKKLDQGEIILFLYPSIAFWQPQNLSLQSSNILSYSSKSIVSVHINGDKNTKFRNSWKNIKIGQFGCKMEPSSRALLLTGLLNLILKLLGMMNIAKNCYLYCLSRSGNRTSACTGAEVWFPLPAFILLDAAIPLGKGLTVYYLVFSNGT